MKTIIITGCRGQLGREINKYYADKCKHGSERCRFEQADKDIVARYSAEAEQPGGDSCADVCAHDNVYALAQCHYPGVYKADDHNRCRR